LAVQCASLPTLIPAPSSLWGATYAVRLLPDGAAWEIVAPDCDPRQPPRVAVAIVVAPDGCPSASKPAPFTMASIASGASPVVYAGDSKPG
jgi:hypothetical protein